MKDSFARKTARFALSRGQSGTLASGTSFPTSPSTGDKFYRTDRNLEYSYDGTRWLTTSWFSIQFPSVRNTTGTQDFEVPVPYIGVYSIYLENLQTTALRTGEGEFDVVLRWGNAANTLTVLATADGAGAATNTWDDNTVALNTVLDTSAKMLAVVYTTVSGTFSFYAGAMLTYRLVG